MSDRQIQVGDLVQVVRWDCCGHNLGKVATVENIDFVRDTYCIWCGKNYLGVPNADMVLQGGHGELRCAPLSWLKRIPPLEELESNDMCHPMKEPA